jgi:hypothetical protein
VPSMPGKEPDGGQRVKTNPESRRVPRIACCTAVSIAVAASQGQSARLEPEDRRKQKRCLRRAREEARLVELGLKAKRKAK